MNVHALVLFPPLEHAPDQTASRPLDTVRVTDVPAVKLAEPVLPTGTLMPAGVEVMRSPLLPVTDTVNIAVPVGATGLRVTVAVLAAPPKAPVIVTVVEAVTAWEETAKEALVDPDGTVTLAGTVTTAVLPLDRVTTAPPDGAAAVSVAVPWTAVPPVTLVGFIVSAERAGAAGVPCGVKLRILDHEPAVPAALRPRTRHQC